MGKYDLIEAIRRRAYEIWLGEGRPNGRDFIHWQRAQAEFRERFAADHCADHCHTGLHEKPVEPRSRKQRLRRRTNEFDGQGFANGEVKPPGLNG